MKYRRKNHEMTYEEAFKKWAALKDSLWKVTYSRPPTSEVMFGTEDSMNQMRDRGYAPLIRSGGVFKASIESITPLQWDEFLSYYKIKIKEHTKDYV